MYISTFTARFSGGFYIKTIKNKREILKMRLVITEKASVSGGK